MKILSVRNLIAVALAAVPGALQAQPDAHYVPGIEGLYCATLPLPGFYFRDYNVFYHSDQLNNGAGNAIPGTFNAITYANVPRAIWITDTKVLGGYLGGDVVVPLVYNQLSMNMANVPVPGAHTTYHSSTFGLGDIYAEGTLSWHPGQFDIGTALGLNMPTGSSGQLNGAGQGTKTSAGLGYWGPQFTLGATYYFDTAKTWAISALNRYEINSEDRDLHNFDITPGQAWTLEYGICKSLKNVCSGVERMDLGVAGYYQQRVTKSTGDQPFAEIYFPYSRVAAAGPEINIECKFCTTSIRYNYEFMADNRAQGQTLTVTLTKKF